MSGWRVRATTTGLVLAATLIAISTLILTPPPSRLNYSTAEDAPRLYQDGRGAKVEELSEEDLKSIQVEPSRTNPIDLTLYVVFHRKLYDYLYDELNVTLHGTLWSWNASQKYNYRPNAGGELTEGVEVVFLATNPSIEKVVNDSNSLFQGRVVNEWEMHGYNPTIGSAMNEYGAMGTVYNSGWTQTQPPNASLPLNFPSTSTQASVSAPPSASKGATVEEWIGFLQYDMKLDTQLIDRIRRKIHSRAAEKVKGWGGSTFERKRRRGQPLDNPGSSSRKCCIFASVVYPTKYLLHNALGQLLVRRYNEFFRTQFKLSDLPEMSVLDMFIVPTAFFNKIMPFLTNTMLDLAQQRTWFPDPLVPLPSGPPSSIENNATTAGGVSRQKRRSAKPIVVMEAALAVALGLGSEYRQVLIPLRHDRPADLEGHDPQE